MFKVGQDKTEFDKITAMQDSHKKFLKLSDYMFKVAPCSCYWNKAKQESVRLIKLGYGFLGLGKEEAGAGL